MSNKSITIDMPCNLYMGGLPFNQVTALYHYRLTHGALTVQKYAGAWGWCDVEVSSFISSMQFWNDPCNNINNNTAKKTTTTHHTNINNINIHSINIGDGDSISVDCSNTDRPENLIGFIESSDECIELLALWLGYYKSSIGSIESIDARSLACLSARVREGHADKVKQIIEWLWTGGGRALWLRQNGFVYLYSVLSRNNFVKNEKESRAAKKISALPEKNNQQRTVRSIESLQFDEHGNFIGGK